MSTVVNVWMGELTKLTEKIRLKKTQQQPNFFLKSQNEADNQIEEHEESGITTMEAKKPASVLLKSPTMENQLSEEVVFWLMDRFAPC